MADMMMELIKANVFSFVKAKSLPSSSNSFKVTNGRNKQ
jgi:hypothetical protein